MARWRAALARAPAGRGALAQALAAGLLSLLAGCATPYAPAAEVAALPPSAAPAPAPAADPGPGAAPAARSRLADFLSRRLQRPAEAPAAAPVSAAPPEAPPSAPAVDEKYRLTGQDARELERGHASWYAAELHGRRTASGESYDKYALTAAHRTLPFGTIVRVRSLALGREVDVRINDRGPFSRGRVIDVSQAAAEALGLTRGGLGQVSLEVAGADARAAAPARKAARSSKAARATARRAAARPAPRPDRGR